MEMNMTNNNDRMKIEIMDTTEYTNWTMEEWAEVYSEVEMVEMMKRYMDYTRANKKYRQNNQAQATAVKQLAKSKGLSPEQLLELIKGVK